MFLKYSLLGLFCLIGSNAFSSNPWSYVLLQYPVQQNNCQDLADAFAKKLNEATRVPIVDAYCEFEAMGVADIRIRYEADAPLYFISTDVIGYDSMGQHQVTGAYHSKRECNEDLSRQTNLYKEMTGLSPIAAYCYTSYQPPSFSETLPYSVRIDGYGTPKETPFLFDDPMGAIPMPQADSLARTMEKAAVKQGIKIAKTGIKSFLVSNRATIYYYAKKKIPLVMWRSLKFDSQALCEKQLLKATKLFQRGDRMPLLYLCLDEPGNSFSEIDVLSIWEPGDLGDIVKKNYLSYDDCEKEIPEMLKQYETKYKWKTYGALCGRRYDQISPTKVVMYIQGQLPIHKTK